jgi:predicted O-methyltransferase YrrM
VISPDLSEARYTVPRDECPHPEWWTAEDDDSTELEVAELVGAFVRALQPEVVVETGTAWGVTAAAIGRALSANAHGRLVTAEPNDERAAAARRRCEGLPVEVVTARSFEVDWPAPIDFAWLDSHMPIRADEFRSLRPRMRTGAIVGLHDAGPQHGHRAEWEAIEGLRCIYLPTPRGVLFGEVLA